MKLVINEEQKLAELWVSHSDPEHAVASAIQQYKNAYMVVVFRSGVQDLTSCTQALLRHNYA